MSGPSLELLARVRAWLEDDPDADDRAELGHLLEEGATEELTDRFADRLHFGTAGLRGAVAAGPNRMNRAVVRATTAALCRWLATHRPGAAEAGVVVGCDARHRSSEFADEATAVLTGAGFRVHRLADRRPTPLLAFAVPHLEAAAGVMVTASHNPPADNGYKLYLGDGAQIVPPVDAEIEALIDEVGPLGEVPLGSPADPLVRHHGDELVDAYLSAIEADSVLSTARPPLRVVYTPMHGVAGGILLRALAAAGFVPPVVVAEQAEADPDFPTVSFPNPEEPGALGLAFAVAAREEADLIVANDPDGDRMAVAVPDGAAAGGWRRLTGDEVGVLLGAAVVEGGSGDDRLVAASIVSSSMLGRIAEAHGVHFAATLTGFKWIVRATEAVPGSRFCFGYEEALGYAVGPSVRDKDGIGASLAFLSVAGELAERGVGVLERLDELAARFGVHDTRQISLRDVDTARIMASLRAEPPSELAGEPVASVVDLAGGVAWQEGLPPLPPADVVALRLNSGARVIVRPSGTEPKLKAYLEVVRAVAGGDVPGARTGARDELDRLDSAVGALLA